MVAKKGLYANIAAKKARIAAGSKEKMRKVGSKGAPTAASFKKAAKTAKPVAKKAGGIIKKGFHRMPDGRIMKDSAHKAGPKRSK
jgi:nitrous oxide reductase accessory protein NosL|tara:strand:- start:89 stop:343 length:255 start_codon:yes stop_codon:yes gene_type:complete